MRNKTLLDCLDYFNEGFHKNGIYSVKPTGKPRMLVFCNMEVDGGGWSVIQRRFKGNISFNKTWEEYEGFFGYRLTDHWLGLINMNSLLSFEAGIESELRVDIEDFDGNKGYAKYSEFFVGNASTKYELTVGGYSGNIGDKLSYHNGMKFTTFDNDNDKSNDTNCAQDYSSGWWFNLCYNVNLNGISNNPPRDNNAYGIIWYDWQGAGFKHLKRTRLMIRRRATTITSKTDMA